MAHSRLFSLITGKDKAVAQRFKSVLLRVKLSGTDSTNRKDPGLPGSSAAFPVEPWAAPASSSAPPLLQELTPAAISDGNTHPLYSPLPPPKPSCNYLQGSYRLGFVEISPFQCVFNNVICLRFPVLNCIHFFHEA